jgi:hypothetical protein
MKKYLTYALLSTAFLFGAIVCGGAKSSVSHVTVALTLAAGIVFFALFAALTEQAYHDWIRTLGGNYETKRSSHGSRRADRNRG